MLYTDRTPAVHRPAVHPAVHRPYTLQYTAVHLPYTVRTALTRRTPTSRTPSVHCLLPTDSCAPPYVLTNYIYITVPTLLAA